MCYYILAQKRLTVHTARMGIEPTKIHFIDTLPYLTKVQEAKLGNDHFRNILKRNISKISLDFMFHITK